MRVTQLWRYPVKSMRGELLLSTRFERGGIPFDRRYALLDETPQSAHRGKATTATQFPAMLGYGARVTDDSVVVRLPDGAVTGITEAAVAERLSQDTGLRLALIDAPDGTNHDEADVLVINEASVRQLALEWGQPVDARRFRPNVVVGGGSAFEEEAWVGRKLRVGSTVLDVASSCVRCSITNVDPETLASDPSFLKMIAQLHRACFGVYCAVSEPGYAGVGDECALLPAGA
ncbi:MAG TPA: MOSC domain-containing protein [Candidatus Eremiobacteraceae bacterium]